MPLASGTRLGSYQVLAPLGAGGMGEVYRAHDSRLGRDVAIKLLPEALASSPERLARFQREARTVAALNHPNIVTLHSIEDSGGVRFLTMELVEGSDLSTLIVSGGLPLAKVLDLAIPLADALVAAHEKRVVHRDLKPANVMLTRDGRVKVLDFGLAKLMEIGSDLELTRAATVSTPISEIGQVVGTAAYMSPEQIRGEEVDARSDLFSFGILVYEMASGKRPFTGHTAADLGSAILRDQPPSLSTMRTDLPSDLGRIVERCLEKNPRERFQTALDVANELRGLKRTMERGQPASPAKPFPEKIASVAVLPFVNRSASADDEYFSDGLADELLNVLAKIRGLRVAARTSAFQFKGKSEDTAVIGQKLHVSTLLEGSVRKAGNRVRISVQLVKAEDGYQLWSETYDRTLDDIFEVQDDIARSVVKELRSTLLGEEHDSKASGEVKAEVAQAVQGRGTDPEAHRLYLYAAHLVDRANPTDTKKAMQYLEEALALDPQFAMAWVMLGVAFANLTFLWEPSEDNHNRTLDAVEHALALNADLAQAHSLLGRMRAWSLDWRAAEASMKRALELAPGDASVLRRAAALAHNLGHMEESIQLNLRALELDPLSSSSLSNLGYVYFNQGRLAEAESAYRKSLELSPARTGSHAWLSLILLGQGKNEEAVKEAEQEPMVAVRLWAQAIVQHEIGHPSESQRALDQLIEEYAKTGAAQIAQVYAARGEKDAAFAWLDRAIQQGDAMELKPARHLQSLHSDPRWNAFLKNIGLDAEYS